MNDYEIYIDASVDIDPAYITDNAIRVIPMNYTIGGEEKTLSGEETPEELHEFYERMRNDELASTSQITPFAYDQAFGPTVAKGKAILSISLSSGITKTYESAQVAVEGLREDYGEDKVQVELVDSLAGTGGMGLMLMLAIRNRNAGMSLSENASFLREHARRICHWFMVEDLKYLKHGGRISPTTAFLGNALNIKPILKIADDGSLAIIGKQRGSMKAVNQLVTLYQNAKDTSLGEDVMICHADAPEKAEMAKEKILECNPMAKIQIRPLSLIIGAHVGPGFLTIDHFGNRNFM